MFPYLDNALSFNWLQNAATIIATTTPTGIDLVNAVGPVGLAVAAPAGGSGSLDLQPVMSTDGTTWVNVPAAAILDPVTGLPTTLAHITSAAYTAVVYLKRDELYRYVSLTQTPNPSASRVVTVQALFARAYTSQAV